MDTTLEEDRVVVREMFDRYFRCLHHTEHRTCCNPEKPLWVNFIQHSSGDVVDLSPPPEGGWPELHLCEARTIRVFSIVEGGS